MTPIWLAFITGLTTGGISCLAVQGGLLASSVAAAAPADIRKASDSGQARMTLAQSWMLVGVFLFFKLIGYTLVGFVLGWLGSFFQFSPITLGFIQILVGLYMLAIAGNILNLHPIFRYAIIQPPTRIFKFLRKRSRDASLLTPAIVGFLTILMPCGVTQATMAIAIASGTPFMGAAIMFAFVLGTSPIFFAIGAAVVELLERKAFRFVAALVVALFAILSINGGVGLTGSPYTLQNFWKAMITPIGGSPAVQGAMAPVGADGKQQAMVIVRSSGYETTASTLKVGVPVKLTLRSQNAGGCARAFTIPSMNFFKVLPENGDTVVEITPTETGRLAFACSMGMFTGQFMVVN